ncbi:MAG: hypothetical protein AB7T10_07025 [bacterium]
MRRFGIALLLLVPLITEADIAFVCTFNSNLIYDRDTIVSVSKNFELPMDFCKDASILFAFTLSGKSLLFYGPSSHNYQKSIMSFDTASDKNRDFLFSDYYKQNGFTPIPPESIPIISRTMGFERLFIVSSAYNGEISPSISSYEEFSLIHDFLLFRLHEKSGSFRETMNLADKFYKKFRDDETALEIYLYSLMNMADFYTADASLDSFYKNREKSEMYFSLKTNLNAIRGNFEAAEHFIENGRYLYPESILLIHDAINLYSVTDSLKMAELADFYRKVLEGEEY